jgi:hypothetical protein
VAEIRYVWAASGLLLDMYMKNAYILILIIVLTSACIKQEQKQNNEGQIVNLLNHNQIDDALIKINKELSIHKTDELLYLKASTLSMRAGVDIYALFPLLKVKIFDIAISQWSQNREFQRKADAQRSHIGVNEQDIEDVGTKDNIKDYKPLSDHELDYKIINVWDGGSFGENQEFCTFQLGVDTVNDPESMGAWPYIKVEDYEYCKEIRKSQVTLDTFKVTPLIDKLIRDQLQAMYRSQWFRKRDKVIQADNYVKILGSFYTVIDMLPIINKITKVSSDGFKDLEEAQEILMQIRNGHLEKGNELGEKSRKQLMMISSLKIVAHVKNAFDLNKVQTITDLFCNSNDRAAEELIESEKDALYLVTAIDDPEIVAKNKLLFEDIKTNYGAIIQEENDHPEYKDHRILKLRLALEAQRKTACLR